MELIKADIINFGKLQNTEFTFEKGLNSFLHENGWGKTTLSVFIKAMFYGMEYTSSKDPEKNEKLKYFPWQGGVYGGSLQFAHNGKEYIVSRTFGLKKSEDTFELRDLKTNKLTDEYTSDLGTEIFGINRETFGRSIYVTLAESPAGSDDISARLNNLIEADDVSNFENACEILNKKVSALKALRGSAGEIQNLQSKIEKDIVYIEEIKAKINQNDFYDKKAAEIEAELKTQKEKLEEYTTEISNNAKYESKVRYLQLQDDLKNLKAAESKLLDFFNGELPDSGSVSNIDSLLQDYLNVEANIENQSATQSEKDNYASLKEYFGGDIPSKEQIEKCIKTDNEYKNFLRNVESKKLTEAEKTEFEPLNSKFGTSEINSAQISDMIKSVEAVQTQKNTLIIKQAELQSKENEKSAAEAVKPKNIKRITGLTVGILLMTAGIICFVMKIPVAGFICVPLGIAAVIFGIISKTEKADCSELIKQIDDLQTAIQSIQKNIHEAEDKYKAFIRKYSFLDSDSDISALNNISLKYERFATLSKKLKDYENWINAQPQNKDEFEDELKIFVKRYCKTENISAVSSEVQILNDKLSLLDSLEKKINNDSINSQKQKEYKEKLNQVLVQYKTDKTLSFVDQIHQIHDSINTIKNTDESIKVAAQKIKDFEENPANDIKSFDSLKKPENSIEEIKKLHSELSNQIAEKNKLIADYQKKIEDNLADTERKEDIETEIEALQIQKKAKEEERKLLNKTLELLKKAKDNIDANYSDPMKKNFDKYIKMLDQNLNVFIDTDLKVSVDIKGKSYDSLYLSEGYKDMVNFCSRMALIDSLFQEAKPPVILDDPFVNLDDEKTAKALKLIKEMSGEKQIIYFACHKSREVKY